MGRAVRPVPRALSRGGRDRAARPARAARDGQQLRAALQCAPRADPVPASRTAGGEGLVDRARHCRCGRTIRAAAPRDREPLPAAGALARAPARDRVSMSRRRHEMPFGAQVLPDGRVRFRLWAPAARHVDLVLQLPAAPDRVLPLEASAGGWQELTTDQARTGSRYCFSVDGGMQVSDPASRRNPQGVHGPSEVVDPESFDWTDGEWRARPWQESVVYELHVGTFTPEGTFAGVVSRLEHLQRLGVTAIELMPIAEFPGSRGWGYDGVLPYAPACVYGSPEDFKSLVCAAHAHGIAVMLDVVYNHFGHEG